MNKTLSNFILIIIISLVFINCANRGTPMGGDKDITPPSIVKSEPENFSTNFKGKEFKIYFDEYIKIKDLQKQLIISPPMKTQPSVAPLGSASKNITIKIFDTLQPNSTYAFNFGNSIVDNNEGNPYTYYRYVFSTGYFIDSLTVKGNIMDAIKRKPDTFVSVGLYEIDSTFNDSIIYKENPKYVTNTLDSATTFSIENIKTGKYLLMALKDGNGDNKFQQKADKIAFYNSFINVPTDSLYTLKLFAEDLDFKPTRPLLVSGEKIAFGFEGDYKGISISLLSEVPEEFEHRITKDEKTDTLYYWYKPKLEVDSLVFKVKHPFFEGEDFTVRIKEQKRDSLTINTSPSGTIGLDEPFLISGSTPFKAFNASKITIMDIDSTEVNFSTGFDTLTNTYALNFKKTLENNYRIQALPEAFIDFFNAGNDTLNYTLKTKKESEFSKIRVLLKNATYPVIAQLTDENGEVKVEQYSTEPEALDFLFLSPGNYYVQVVFDANGNKKYDTGSYLKKVQPERISYRPDKIEARADWDNVVEFVLIPE